MTVQCTECGTSLNEGYSRCPACGRKQKKPLRIPNLFDALFDLSYESPKFFLNIIWILAFLLILFLLSFLSKLLRFLGF